VGRPRSAGHRGPDSRSAGSGVEVHQFALLGEKGDEKRGFRGRKIVDWHGSSEPGGIGVRLIGRDSERSRGSEEDTGGFPLEGQKKKRRGALYGAKGSSAATRKKTSTTYMAGPRLQSARDT